LGSRGNYLKVILVISIIPLLLYAEESFGQISPQIFDGDLLASDFDSGEIISFASFEFDPDPAFGLIPNDAGGFASVETGSMRVSLDTIARRMALSMDSNTVGRIAVFIPGTGDFTPPADLTEGGRSNAVQVRLEVPLPSGVRATLAMATPGGGFNFDVEGIVDGDNLFFLLEDFPDVDASNVGFVEFDLDGTGENTEPITIAITDIHAACFGDCGAPPDPTFVVDPQEFDVSLGLGDQVVVPITVTTDGALSLDVSVTGTGCEALDYDIDGATLPDVIFSDLGETSYSFTIEYSDVGGIDVTSIGDCIVEFASASETKSTTGHFTVTPPTVTLLPDVPVQRDIVAGGPLVGTDYTVSVNPFNDSLLGAQITAVLECEDDADLLSETDPLAPVVIAADTDFELLVGATAEADATVRDCLVKVALSELFLESAPKTATYTVTPPGGSWDATDNGLYTMGMVGGEAFDLGDKVEIPITVTADAPVDLGVSLTGTNCDALDHAIDGQPLPTDIFAGIGETVYSLTIEFNDDGGIDVGTIDKCDIVITGPNETQSLTGTYIVNPPPPDPNEPPTIKITAPSSGDAFLTGETVTLTANAEDFEDGPLDSKIEWKIGGLDFGLGPEIMTDLLAVGDHIVTASVTDSIGQTTETSITITIFSLPTIVSPSVYAVSLAEGDKVEFPIIINADASVPLVVDVTGTNCDALDHAIVGNSVPDVIFTGLGDTSYSFTIEYSDVGGIDVSTIGPCDITVNGISGPIADSPIDGSPITGTYTVTPPGGSWDATDDGTYTMGIVGGEAFDLGDKVEIPITVTADAPVDLGVSLTGTNCDALDHAIDGRPRQYQDPCFLQ